MAQLTLLTYRRGNTPLFNLDVRCKVICLGMMTISGGMAGWHGLALLTVILGSLFHITGLSAGSTVRGMVFFWILLGIILLTRSLTTPGEALGELDLGMVKITLSREGVAQGAMICWRFICIMLLGILFSTTTNPSDLKLAVEWLVKPVPFIPEKRAGMMVALFVRFLPLILHRAKEVSDAQGSRCGALQKNPVKRIVRMGVPLMNKIFLSADRLADAMESRCYTEDSTKRDFKKSGSEIYFYGASSLLAAMMILL
ncbi:MAG: energy-coupling factor transporter transmembrane protein EcfT [Desulfamplus sp.]|nr:energy-coupling factor transporter transmembrane protein EcfT [Desulfamplus sp.]